MPVFFRPVHLRGPLRTSSIVPIQISVNSVPSLFQTGADCALRKVLTADAATQAHRALLPPPLHHGTDGPASGGSLQLGTARPEPLIGRGVAAPRRNSLRPPSPCVRQALWSLHRSSHTSHADEPPGEQSILAGIGAVRPARSAIVCAVLGLLVGCRAFLLSLM